MAELEDQEERSLRAARHIVETGTQDTRTSGWSVTGEPSTYRDPSKDPSSPSFFLDLRNAKLGDFSAAQRLQRHTQETGREIRALGNTGATGGSGGEFAPPAWLVDEFISLARPGRVIADKMNKNPLPVGVSSINLPKVLSGTTTAVQTTQNTALSQTDLTTGSVSSGIVSIGGKQVVSLQLLQQSGVPFDRVVLEDLASDYARRLDTQVISGAGSGGQLRGLLNGASVGATTFTSGSPAVVSTTTANSFYNKIISAANSIYLARFKPADAIFMHPTRWSWIMEYLDTANRPLVTPDGALGSLNSIGSDGANVAEGMVGTLNSLPVYTDPNLPTTLGAGSNQDVAIVARTADCWLYESELQLAAFEETYADSAGVLYRALGYSAFIPDRFGPSVNIIGGTGMIVPTL